MAAQLSANSIAKLYQPSSCELRTWLLHDGTLEPSPPSSFDQFLFDQGIEHERRILEELTASASAVVDAGGFENPEALQITEQAVSAGDSLIYQGKLTASVELLGQEVQVVGATLINANLGEAKLDPRGPARREPDRRKPSLRGPDLREPDQCDHVEGAPDQPRPNRSNYA